MRRWEREVLLILEEEIAALQHGRAPELPDEFRAAFLRFGVEANSLPIEATNAILIEDCVYLPAPESVELWRSVYLHELAEAVLLWEGRAPYCYPPEPPEAARHRIALYFELLHAPEE